MNIHLVQNCMKGTQTMEYTNQWEDQDVYSLVLWKYKEYFCMFLKYPTGTMSFPHTIYICCYILTSKLCCSE